MKTNILRMLGYTLTGVVIIISCSGSSLKAQDKKVERVEKSIIINNGDTTINGKKLSEASKSERRQLMKEFEELDRDIKDRVVVRKRGDRENKEIIIRKKGDKEPRILRWENEGDEDFDFELGEGPARAFRFNNDSLLVALEGDSTFHSFRFKMDGPEGIIRNRVFSPDHQMQGSPEMMHPRMFMDGMGFSPDFIADSRNSQNFSFSTTDKEGITNRMNIRISDLTKDQLKKVTGSEDSKNELQITDLTIFPNFSSGKLTVSFSLPAKEPVDFKVLDSELKTVFADKVTNFNGNYLKQISLPMNGIYYLSIKQGPKSYSKKLTKE
jgi:hypothetical protein